MSRPRHRYGEYEQLFSRLESKSWRVEGGGERHFKLKCPCPTRCRVTVSTTPRSRSGTFAIVMRQLNKQTCWEDR